MNVSVHRLWNGFAGCGFAGVSKIRRRDDAILSLHLRPKGRFRDATRLLPGSFFVFFPLFFPIDRLARCPKKASVGNVDCDRDDIKSGQNPWNFAK